MSEPLDISVLVGKTFNRVTSTKGDEHNFDAIEFVSDTHCYRLSNDEDAINDVRVWLADLVGDLNDLIGAPIVKAEYNTSRENDFATWGFYHLATKKGYVTMRWCGESNGHYSEEAYLIELPQAKSKSQTPYNA